MAFYNRHTGEARDRISKVYYNIWYGSNAEELSNSNHFYDVYTPSKFLPKTCKISLKRKMASSVRSQLILIYTVFQQRIYQC